MHRMDLDSTEKPAESPPASPFPHPVDGVWLGALVPKRWARRAVTRHLVKRQIHAQGAVYADQLSPAAYLVRMRGAFSRDLFPSAASDALRHVVRREIQQLFGKTARRLKVPA